MNTRLYVGNLAYTITKEQLTEYFSQAGEVVNVEVISDKFSGRSKGYAFVEMGSSEAAQNAINMFDGKEYEGRTLKVNEARPKREQTAQNY